MRTALASAQDNRRRFGRRETFKWAKLILSSGALIPCAVTNVSEGGALLQLREVECQHDEFQLLIIEDDFLVACQVAHRDSGNIGVRFVRSPRRASRVATAQSERARVLIERAFGGKA